MPKTKTKKSQKHVHKKFVSGILAALAFAIVIGSQLGSVENPSQLATNAMCYGPNWTSNSTTCGPMNNNGSSVGEAACTGAGYSWSNNDCMPAGGGGAFNDPNAPQPCLALNNQPKTPNECATATAAKNACGAPSTWNGSGAGSCTAAPAATTSYPAGNCNGVAYPAGTGTPPPCGTTPYNNAGTTAYPAGNCNGVAYPAGTGTPPTCGTTPSNNAGTTACTQDQITKLGTSCHPMGAGVFNGEMNKYILQGSTAVMDCITSPVQGCSAGGANNYNNNNNYTADTIGACTARVGDGKQGQWDAASSTCSVPPGSGSQNTYPTNNQQSPAQMQAACVAAKGTWKAAVPPATNGLCEGGQTYGTQYPNIGTDPQNTDTLTQPYQPQPYAQPTFNFNDFNSGPQCSATKSLNANPYCYGNHKNGWNWEKGCTDSGNQWKASAQTEFGTGDCFPGFGGFGPQTTSFGPALGNFMPFGQQPTTATKTPNFSDFLSGGAATQGNWCSTTQGQRDPMCSLNTGDYSFFNDFDTASMPMDNMGPSQFDTDQLSNLRSKIDDVVASTGGAYCEGVEKAEELYAKAYANSSVLVKAGPYMGQVFEALAKCQGQTLVLQEISRLQSMLSTLKVSTEFQKEYDKLTSDLAALQADPSKLLNFKGYGPGPMESYWRRFENLKNQSSKQQFSKGDCEEASRLAKDIQTWTSGSSTDGPAATAPNLAQATVVLASLNDAATSGDKTACKRALSDAERAGKSMGVELHDQDDFMMRNMYGNDFLEDQASKYSEIEGFDIESLMAELKAEMLKQVEAIKKQIVSEVAKIVSEQLKIAFKDIEAAIASSPGLSKIANYANTAADKLGDEIKTSSTEAMASRSVYLPESALNNITANHDTAMEGMNIIINNVPKDMLEDIPAVAEVTQQILVENIPATTASAIAAPTMVMKLQNTIAATIEDGEVIPGKEETLKKAIKEFTDNAETQLDPANLTAAQFKEGINGVHPAATFTDYSSIPRWTTEALNGQVSRGNVKGEGDGSSNPDGFLTYAHVATMATNMTDLESDPTVANLSATTKAIAADPNKAWMLEGGSALYKAGVFEQGDVEMSGETITRGEAMGAFVASLGKDDSEIAKMIAELPWKLAEAGYASPESLPEKARRFAKEINFGYTIGAMTGQTAADGTKNLDLEGIFNRAQSWKVTGILESFRDELANIGLEAMLEKLGITGPQTTEPAATHDDEATI